MERRGRKEVGREGRREKGNCLIARQQKQMLKAAKKTGRRKGWGSKRMEKSVEEKRKK